MRWNGQSTFGQSAHLYRKAVMAFLHEEQIICCMLDTIASSESTHTTHTHTPNMQAMAQPKLNTENESILQDEDRSLESVIASALQCPPKAGTAFDNVRKGCG